MGKQLNISMVDGKGKPAKRNFGLVNSATAADAGAIVDQYALLTDCGVVAATVTQTSKTTATFAQTTAAPAARVWRVGRITFSLAQDADGGGASLGTIEIPSIKATYVDATGQIKDNPSALGLFDGDIANFADLFLTAGKGRINDGQAIASNAFVSGYAYDKAHKEAEN